MNRKVLLILGLIGFGWGIPNCFYAQNAWVIEPFGQVSDSCDFVWGDSHQLYLQNKGKFYRSDSPHSLDPIAPTVRGLILMCGGPYSTLVEKGPKWKSPTFFTMVPYQDLFLGIHSQLTALAFYDRELNLQASHPIAFPFESEEYYSFHNYWSHFPAAFLGDTMAFALIPINHRDVRVEESKSSLPSIACFDLTSFPRFLPDTLGKDSVRPYTLGGSYPLPDTGYANFCDMVMFGGVIADSLRKQFIVWNGGTPDIQWVSTKGQLTRTIGEQGKNLGKVKPKAKGWDGWRARFPKLVGHWLQPIYGDVVLSLDGAKVFRLYYAPMEVDVMERKKPVDWDFPEFFRYSQLRKTYLQVYDYASGKLLEEIPLPQGVTRITGHDADGNLTFWGKEGWNETLYRLVPQ